MTTRSSSGRFQELTSCSRSFLVMRLLDQRRHGKNLTMDDDARLRYLFTYELARQL
jgi:hypothetical protein